MSYTPKRRPLLLAPTTGVLCALLLAPIAQAKSATGDAAKAAKGKAANESFVCTQIMGVSVTEDWFNAGFESGVDNKRFQSMARKKAFIELWGDPKNEVWSVPVVSPCADRASNPDRVVFTAVNWEFKTVEEWTAALNKAVAAISAKYSGVKRIELLTMLRGPGNKTCGNEKTVVAPAIDEAIAKVVAAHPKLVKPGPKVEVPDCTVFTNGGPHYTPEGMAAVAKLYVAAFTH